MNYYSEWDPYAAQWIRNLIDAGLIPPGHVDTRSITDVQPSDLAGYRQCHFFAGIAGWSLAARLAGWPDDRELWTGSAPCQPFSVAGKGKAQDDDRHLWPHFLRLIRARRPAVVMGERRLARTGSTECLLTWKQRTTPAGRSLSQLVPSTRPIAGIDSGLWPTPMAHEARLGYQRRRGDTKGSQESLTTVVVNVSAPLDDPRIAGLWPTPTASLADKGVRSTEGAIREATRNHGPDLAAVSQAAVALYPTPRASANENRPTRIPPSQLDGRHGLYLSSVAIGMEPAGSSATTENSGALNPAFVCWLMGFLPAWDACAPTVTPSSRKSRPK